MPIHAVIPATISSHNPRHAEHSPLVDYQHSAGPSDYKQRSRSYGATSNTSSPATVTNGQDEADDDGLETIGEGLYLEEDEEDEGEEVVVLDGTCFISRMR
jgi:hypothetical protein